jgi:hypothetical protein
MGIRMAPSSPTAASRRPRRPETRHPVRTLRRGARPDTEVGPYGVDQRICNGSGSAHRGRRALYKGLFMSVGAHLRVRPNHRSSSPVPRQGHSEPVRTLVWESVTLVLAKHVEFWYTYDTALLSLKIPAAEGGERNEYCPRVLAGCRSEHSWQLCLQVA